MIRSVAVLGAGTMGAQIAAHSANAGLPVLLLDLSADVARQGLERAIKLKPDPFFTPEARRLITVAGFDEGLPRLGTYDWILEAVVERLDVKQELFARVERYAAPEAIVSSNTSGLPIAALGDGRSAAFRRHLLGTHFFNPPRYLPLLEIIPTPDTDPALIDEVSAFTDRRLGKGVVVAKDRPGFIANRLGMFGVARLLQVLASGEYTVEEIDAITGRAIGRPKSATFRTVDIAGLDVLANVARDLATRLEDPEEREAFTLPPLVEEMLRRGWIGEKAGQGFYKRQKNAAGETEILALDPKTMEYRPQQKPKLGALEAAKSIEDTASRIRALFLGRNRTGDLLRSTLGPSLRYAAQIAPSVAYSLDDVDRVMRWGYGWELGPFETWDAIGAREVLAASATAPAAAWMGAAPTAGPAGAVTAEPGDDMATVIANVLTGRRGSFRSTAALPPRPSIEILRAAKERERVVRSNAGASLVDLGDGVLAVEFHSKMNALGGDAIETLQAGVVEAERNFRALLVGNDAPNFSAGANLMLVLLEAQEENWEDIDAMVRAFQNATMALRCAGVPVVVAPGGLALGGGCEIVLHGARAQAAAETYMGLVEVGVGLIPAGGGTKEMLARAVESVLLTPTVDLLAPVQKVFETIGFAKVSTSAADAKKIGYLRPADGITMNRDRVLADAKALALALVEPGYQPQLPRTAIPVGGENILAALKLGIHLGLRAGRISEHDATVGRKLAWILSGGSLPHATTVNEQYLLDLEREAFLSLCGEPKTQERMQYTLKTGKTLRN